MQGIFPLGRLQLGHRDLGSTKIGISFEAVTKQADLQVQAHSVPTSVHTRVLQDCKQEASHCYLVTL